MEGERSLAKRARLRSPSPTPRRGAKNYRRNQRSHPFEHDFNCRLGQSSADRDAAEWINKEDEFVLRQGKKKAQIRAREGRAKPIDLLAVVLAVADPERDLVEDDDIQEDLNIVNPVDMMQELGSDDLSILEKDIGTYLVLESRRENRKFWRAAELVCREHLRILDPDRARARGIKAVLDEIALLLEPKSRPQLDALENQVRNKLRSNEDIDVEYWERLLSSIHFHKAKTDLDSIYGKVSNSRLQTFRLAQLYDAKALQKQISRDEKISVLAHEAYEEPISNTMMYEPAPSDQMNASLSRPRLTSEPEFLSRVGNHLRKTQKIGFVPALTCSNTMWSGQTANKVLSGGQETSQSTNAMYNREAARGFEEDEEAFAAEEELQNKPNRGWEGQYRARKPKYFNRVQMGYEWNKYNQTHYDHDNPPPKVVQGYKFNVFYPDLIDTSKAPTYQIEREHGRKKGQSFAPAGKEDTCIIRFTSGPPYEDLAFRIVDKEWDYSAKRERGFRSYFDKGILQLHFQFKKVYYRK